MASFEPSIVRNKVKQQVVTVTTSATKLPATPLAGRRVLIVQNLSTNRVRLGDSSVTTTGSTEGLYLANQYDSLSISLADNVDLYAVASTNSSVAVFEAA